MRLRDPGSRAGRARAEDERGEDRRLGWLPSCWPPVPGSERHKLLCKVGGVPLVRRAVDSALAADLDETIVVMGAVDLLEVLPEEVTVLHNEAWEQGQATSLAAAVSYAGSRGHRAVVFGCGDQPGVPRRRGRVAPPTATCGG